jgi:hypothetical protein
MPQPSAGADGITFPRPRGGRRMRSLILYVLGVPLPIILLLALITHHC